MPTSKRLLLQFTGVGQGRNAPGRVRPAVTLATARLGGRPVDEVWLISGTRGREDDLEGTSAKDVARSLHEEIARKRGAGVCRHYVIPGLGELDPPTLQPVANVLRTGDCHAVTVAGRRRGTSTPLRPRLEDLARAPGDTQILISMETGAAAHLGALLEVVDRIGFSLAVVLLEERKPELLTVAESRLGGYGGTGPRGPDAIIDHLSRLPGGATVLWLGETGVGKTRAARELHERWVEREERNESFDVLNAAAVPPTLVESELFGHTKGAFTGAGAARTGLLESCEGGTLLLDEVGEMPLSLQAKMLTVLRHRGGCRIRPVGDSKERDVDVRVLFATNRNLAEMCKTGAFRLDLLARIGAHQVRLEPLRERKQAALVAYVRSLDAQAERYGRIVHLHREVLRALTRFALSDDARWTWNYRDVEQSAERLVFAAFARQGYENAGARLQIGSNDLAAEIETLRSQWAAVEMEVDDDWSVLRAALASGEFARLSALDRWRARYLLVAIRAHDGNKAAAWKWLTEEKRLLPSTGGRNGTTAFTRAWHRFRWVTSF